MPPDQETTGVGGVGPPEEFISATFPPPDAGEPATIGVAAGASVIGRMPFPAESWGVGAEAAVEEGAPAEAEAWGTWAEGWTGGGLTAETVMIEGVAGSDRPLIADSDWPPSVDDSFDAGAATDAAETKRTVAPDASSESGG